MQKFKDRWEINSSWQLIFPVLGLVSLIFSSYLISKSILRSIHVNNDATYIGLQIAIIVILSALFLFVTLKLFKVLAKKWEVTYRWELIAIFIAFAITGSTAARISDPMLSFIGISKETSSTWLYWILRVFIIFPVYQILLLIVGWLFGQFSFFWGFEKKMLKRLGFARFIKD
ncbi:DUF6787 family protein [Aquimarina sp. 2201CG1-2-11]|uniref:DUF6787 family protein n=1 Tax=Aquimarina discodermiae TaxID=3231043 RepID=UPI003462A4D3